MVDAGAAVDDQISSKLLKAGAGFAVLVVGEAAAPKLANGSAVPAVVPLVTLLNAANGSSVPKPFEAAAAVVGDGFSWSNAFDQSKVAADDCFAAGVAPPSWLVIDVDDGKADMDAMVASGAVIAAENGSVVLSDSESRPAVVDEKAGLVGLLPDAWICGVATDCWILKISSLSAS